MLRAWLSVVLVLACQVGVARAETAVRHYASPMQGATTIAAFRPEEGWRGGTPQAVATPWGVTSALLLTAEDGAAVAEANVAADFSTNNLRLVFYTESAEHMAQISVYFDVGGGDFNSV